MMPRPQTFGNWIWPACVAAGVLLGGWNNAAAPAAAFSEAARQHWAFQPLVAPALPTPEVANGDNPIDALVGSQLRTHGLSLSPMADRRTWLRRASLDLIGLPPTPEEVMAFLADESPEAFARQVDRLLASPHYGERWARHWLDLARYADSEGFKSDETRPNVWRYRDYVINALNADKPYDRFVQEQLAGDELWPDDPEARVATGFLRHYPDESNARVLPQRRQEILNDITDTVGTVFLGLTMECCRCHDHKYEPLPQRDYYRLQACFANTAARDDTPLLTGETGGAYRAKLALWEEKTRAIREEMEALLAPKRRELERDYFDKYPDDIRAILQKPAAERSPFERQMAAKAAQYLDPASYQYVALTRDVLPKLKPAQRLRYDELKQELASFASLHPGEMPVAAAMEDLGREAPPTFVLNRGIFDSPGAAVEPGLPALLWPEALRPQPPEGRTTTGRRSALARELTTPNNPLTARVMANRVWQHHFGRGLAGTPGDLGLHGEPPADPALLNWLAAELVRGGWSLKHLHRIILTSRTYQQASDHRAAAAKIDPDNLWWWHFPPQRLEGETIRDAALSVAGMLNQKMGGPGFFPELPSGMPAPRGGWSVETDAGERNRRSIYVFARRNARYPMFDAFDMPEAQSTCPRRNVTTSPLQALTLLNDRLTLGWATHLADRVLEATDRADSEAAVGRAFQLAFCRLPSSGERAEVNAFLGRQKALITARQAKGEKIVIPHHPRAAADPVAAAALVDLCHTLLNANEFVYEN